MIHEAHIRGTERMTVRQILAESSNVGTITIAKDGSAGRSSPAGSTASASAGRAASTFRARAAASCSRYDKWSGSTIGNVPIGQGIAVTPLQMVSAYAAIGNGGVMSTPHVDREGRREEGAPREGTPGRLPLHRRPDDGDVPRRRPRGDGHRGRDPRLHGGREDRAPRTRPRTDGTSRSTSRRSSGSSPRAIRGSRSS